MYGLFLVAHPAACMIIVAAQDLVAALREVTTQSSTNPNSAVASVLSRADLDAGIVDEATAALAKHASSTTSLGRVGAARAVASASKARYGTAGGGNASNTSGTKRGAHAGGATPNGSALLQDTTRSAIAELEHVVNANARKYNDTKYTCAEKHRELSALLTELKDLQSENAKLGVVQEGGVEGGGDDASSSGREGSAAPPGISSTPEARRIAQLTRLTRSTEAELGEAESKRGQYQHMLDRLRGNHVQFEGHISAMQAALAATRAEFHEVENNVRALENAKDASALDLAKYQQALGHLRTRRSKELENRKSELRLARKAQRLRAHREEVRAQLAAQISGDLSAEEEAALLRLRSDKVARAAEMERRREGIAQRAEGVYAMFDRVRQATGCRDISHLVDSFSGQEGMSAALQQEARDVQGRLEVVNQAVHKAKSHLDNLRATGGVPGGPAASPAKGVQGGDTDSKAGGEESKAVGSARDEGASVTVDAVQAGHVDVSSMNMREVSARDAALQDAILEQLRSRIHAAERQLSHSTAAADATEQALLSVQQVSLGIARRLAPLCEVLGLPSAEPWTHNAQAVPLLLRAVRQAHTQESKDSKRVSPVKPPPAHRALPAVSEASMSSTASSPREAAGAEDAQAPVPLLLLELGTRLTEEQVQLAASAPSIRKGRGLPTVMQVGAVHPALHSLLLLQCAQERCERTLRLLQAGAGASAPVFNESDLIKAALAAQQGHSLDDVLPPPAAPAPARGTASRRTEVDRDELAGGPSASLISVASSDYGGASLVSPGASLGVPASPPPPLRTQGGRLSKQGDSRAAGTRESSISSVASAESNALPRALSARTWGNLRAALAMRWAGDDSGSEEDEDAPSAQVRAALMGTAAPGGRGGKGKASGMLRGQRSGNKQSSMFDAGQSSTGVGATHTPATPETSEDSEEAGASPGRSVPRGPLRRMQSNAATIMTSLSPRGDGDGNGGSAREAAQASTAGLGEGKSARSRSPPPSAPPHDDTQQVDGVSTSNSGSGSGLTSGERGTPTRPGAAVKVVTPDTATRPSTQEHGTPSTQDTPGSVPRGMGSLAAALLREPPSSLLPTPAVSQRPGGSGSAASLAPSFQGKSMEGGGGSTPMAPGSGLPPRDAPPDAPPTAPAGLTLAARAAHKKRSTSPAGAAGGVGAAAGGKGVKGGAAEGKDGASFATPWSKMRSAVGSTMRFAVDEDEEAEEFEAARHRIKASSSALVAAEAELYILQQGKAEAAELARAHGGGAAQHGGGGSAAGKRPVSGKRARGGTGSLQPLGSGRAGGAAGAVAAALGEDEIAARRRKAAKAAKAAAQNSAMRRLMQPEHNSKGGLSALMQKPNMV